MFNGKGALKHLETKDVRINGVIAIGYGQTQGVQHKSKTAAEISQYGKNHLPLLLFYFQRTSKDAVFPQTRLLNVSLIQRFKFRLGKQPILQQPL